MTDEYVGKKVRVKHRSGSWMEGTIIDYRDVKTYPALHTAVTGAGFPQVKVRIPGREDTWLPMNYVEGIGDMHTKGMTKSKRIFG